MVLRAQKGSDVCSPRKNKVDCQTMMLWNQITYINFFLKLIKIIDMNKSQIATGGMFNPSKSQFRGPDGTGRDPYIYNNNGGFCPPKQPHKIEELGKSPPDLVTPPSN